jgi:hypothetical protein
MLDRSRNFRGCACVTRILKFDMHRHLIIIISMLAGRVTDHNKENGTNI